MDIKLLEKKCEDNGFELIFVKTKEEALNVAKDFVTPGISVGLGGSTTIEEIGLFSYLLKREDINLFNQYENGIEMNENNRRRKEGMAAQLYISSTNALTKNGELVNSDGTGNRVAAQIYGPKKLLIIAGKNKIVESIDAGIYRIKKVAAVKNADRMNKKAISYGKEALYTPENIATKFTIIKSDIKGRTTIILVDEELGY